MNGHMRVSIGIEDGVAKAVAGRVRSPILLLVGIATCFASFSCRRPAEKESKVPESRAARPEISRVRERLSLRERVEGLAVKSKSGDEKDRRETAAATTELLLECFKNNNPGDLEILSKALDDNGLFLYQEVGKDLAGRVTPEEWPQMLGLLRKLDPHASFSIATGLFAGALILDPEKGYALHEREHADFESSAIRLNKGSGWFETTIWTLVARSLLSSGAGEGQVKKLYEITSASPVDAARFHDQLSDEVRLAAAKGDATTVDRYVSMMSEDGKSSFYDSICANPFKIDDTTFGTFKSVLEGMKRAAGIQPDSYVRLGTYFDDKTFRSSVITDPELATSPELQGLLKGWAAKRPQTAVELIIEKTGNPQLAGVAFSSWMEKDSMEASQWLQSQSTGPLKDACSEQLCDYLYKKGSAEEAKGYLEILPADARERLKAKYPSP